MKNSLPDRSLIRQYLLGRLDDKEELEDDLSEGILLNDELAEMVDSIEEEIIEEYLDAALDSADKKAVEEYFLRPPERKKKLDFARLLRHYFEKQQDDLVAVHWRSSFRTYGQFAALILLSVLSLIYISGIRKSQAHLEAELVRERARSASLLEEARLLQSPMVPLTLVSDRSDLSRTTGTQDPHIEIKPSTQRIIVEIALQSGVSGSYDVRLETKEGKGPIWSARLLPLVSASGDAQLVFLLPVQGIKSGDYSFAVSSGLPGSGGPKHYDFQIRLTDR
jgi:hypothetical protein